MIFETKRSQLWRKNLQKQYATNWSHRHPSTRKNGPMIEETRLRGPIRSGVVAGMTVLSPAIGGSAGNAVTQLARALGARHAMSTTTSHAKAEQARTLGFDEVIDLSVDKLGEGVHRITQGYGSDI